MIQLNAQHQLVSRDTMGYYETLHFLKVTDVHEKVGVHGSIMVGTFEIVSCTTEYDSHNPLQVHARITRSSGDFIADSKYVVNGSIQLSMDRVDHIIAQLFRRPDKQVIECTDYATYVKKVHKLLEGTL